MYSVIAFDGQVYGPVDVRTLIAWCQQGRVVASTHLVETQTGRSFTAADMPELAAVLAQAQQAPGPVQNFGNPGTPQQGQYQPQQGQFQTPYQHPQAPYTGQNPYGVNQYPQQFQPGMPSYGSYGQGKSRMVALILCFLVGGLGAHRFYLGHTTSAMAMLIVGLLSCVLWPFIVIAIIWSTIDFFRILAGSMPDSQGITPT